MRTKITWQVTREQRVWVALALIGTQREPVASYASTSLLRLSRRMVSFQRQWDR